jgi:hypothetical protein
MWMLKKIFRFVFFPVVWMLDVKAELTSLRKMYATYLHHKIATETQDKDGADRLVLGMQPKKRGL